MSPRRKIASATLFIILLAASIAIIAYVMSNGSNPIGPAVPSGGGASIAGEDDTTPVLATIVAINAGIGLQGVNSGSGRFTLNVITPTPQPTATPQAGGSTLDIGLPIADGATPADTIYIGVPGKGFTSTGGGEFMVANDIYYEPYNVSQSITVNTLFFLVTSAGAAGNACRVGIYEADNEFQATNLVVDAGQVINDTTGWKSVAIDEILTPGNYVNAIICNSAPALGDHASHTYESGAVSIGTTSATRFVRKLRDSAPTGTPYTNGFANPGDSPFDTIDLGNGGSFVHFLMMRWEVN